MISLDCVQFLRFGKIANDAVFSEYITLDYTCIMILPMLPEFRSSANTATNTETVVLQRFGRNICNFLPHRLYCSQLKQFKPEQKTESRGKKMQDYLTKLLDELDTDFLILNVNQEEGYDE